MGGSNSHELVLLDQAGRALAEARSLDEIKAIRDKAEAVRKYAQSASLGLDVQNRAAELKLRAERQAGKLLSQMMLRGGDRRSKSHRNRLKLHDLGLTPNQSKRWQLQARVPEDMFCQHVRQMRDEGKELTSAGLMRLAKRMAGRPSVLNGHSNGRNGHTKRHRLEPANGGGASNFCRKWDDQPSATAVGEIVCELRNHHHVLDGILSPLYGGEPVPLSTVESRMLRYLMGEIGSLLAQLQAAESQLAAVGRHVARAAI
jgi:hypothetical protein